MVAAREHAGRRFSSLRCSRLLATEEKNRHTRTHASTPTTIQRSNAGHLACTCLCACSAVGIGAERVSEDAPHTRGAPFHLPVKFGLRSTNRRGLCEGIVGGGCGACQPHHKAQGSRRSRTQTRLGNERALRSVLGTGPRVGKRGRLECVCSAHTPEALLGRKHDRVQEIHCAHNPAILTFSG